MRTRWIFILVISVVLCNISVAAGEEVRFEKIVVDRTFRSEGVAVGDINHDGKLDIFAGDVWYEAPNWKMHELRPVGRYDGTKGYFGTRIRRINPATGRSGWSPKAPATKRRYLSTC